MTILVVVAHPDDEVLGCAGTIARYVEEGDEVRIATLGEGITGRFDERKNADTDLIHDLKNKSTQVAKLLGVSENFHYAFPDNRFDGVPLLDIIKTVEGLIEKLKPRIIYTHHPGDLNIDHVITFRAVLTAARPTNECCVKDIYAFEVPSSTEWSFGKMNSVFDPNIFVDISDFIDLKIKLIKIYDSEIRDFPHPRSEQALRIIASRWGSVVGLKFAEAFQLIRSIR